MEERAIVEPDVFEIGSKQLSRSIRPKTPKTVVNLSAGVRRTIEVRGKKERAQNLAHSLAPFFCASFP